jgi:hypothetical protein
MRHSQPKESDHATRPRTRRTSRSDRPPRGQDRRRGESCLTRPVTRREDRSRRRGRHPRSWPPPDLAPAEITTHPSLSRRAQALPQSTSARAREGRRRRDLEDGSMFERGPQLAQRRRRARGGRRGTGTRRTGPEKRRLRNSEGGRRVSSSWRSGCDCDRCAGGRLRFFGLHPWHMCFGHRIEHGSGPLVGFFQEEFPR